MREIKFRAYHKTQGCMYFTQSSIGMEGDGWIESIDFDGKIIQLGCQADEGDFVEGVRFEDIELMQFTGLKDKNGKEIYEGDIVTYSSTGFIGEVKFEVLGQTRFYLSGKEENHNLYLTSDIEVIGNIYSNPELLN